jgi:hypothetical protein
MDEPTLKITGTKGGIVRNIEEDLDEVGVTGSLYLTSDKPLYQPGQIFGLRALYLDVNNTVVTDAELEFTILDADGNVALRQKELPQATIPTRSRNRSRSCRTATRSFGPI